MNTFRVSPEVILPRLADGEKLLNVTAKSGIDCSFKRWDQLILGHLPNTGFPKRGTGNLSFWSCSHDDSRIDRCLVSLKLELWWYLVAYIHLEKLGNKRLNTISTVAIDGAHILHCAICNSHCLETNFKTIFDPRYLLNKEKRAMFGLA